MEIDNVRFSIAVRTLLLPRSDSVPLVRYLNGHAKNSARPRRTAGHWREWRARVNLLRTRGRTCVIVTLCARHELRHCHLAFIGLRRLRNENYAEAKPAESDYASCIIQFTRTATGQRLFTLPADVPLHYARRITQLWAHLQNQAPVQMPSLSEGWEGSHGERWRTCAGGRDARDATRIGAWRLAERASDMGGIRRRPRGLFHHRSPSTILQSAASALT